jgi:hypothetical protein
VIARTRSHDVEDTLLNIIHRDLVSSFQELFLFYAGFVDNVGAGDTKQVLS